MDESIRIPVIIEGDKAFIALNDIAKSARNTGVAVRGLGDPMKSTGNAAFAFNQILRETPAFAFNFQTGIMAISNNLPVFTDALKRAREAGSSNMQILKGLGSSLVSLPSILSFASLGFMLFGDKIMGTNDKIEEHSEAVQMIETDYDKLVKSIEQVTGSMAKEATQLMLAKAAVESSGSAIRDRASFIEEINKKYPEYISNIEKEGDGYAKITEEITGNLKALANAAEIKALLPQAEKIFEGIIQNQIELNKLKRINSYGPDNFFGMSEEDYKAEEQLLKNNIKRGMSEITQAKKMLTELAGSGANLYEILYGNVSGTSPKVKVKKPELLMPDLKGQSLDLGPGVVVRIQEGMMGVEAPKTFNEILAKKIQDDIGKLVVRPNVRIAFNKDAFNLAQEQAKLIEQLNTSLKQIMGDAVMSIAEGIGSAIGTGEISNAFKTIASAIGQGFIAIGKQMVAASPVITALKTAIKTLNPAVLLPAGLSLIAIGSALRASMNNSIKLASGGLLFNRTLAEVGEGIGTTRQNPEVVAPLDKLKGFFADMVTGRTYGRAAGSSYGDSNMNIPDVVYLYADGDGLRGTLSLNGLKQGRLR